MGSSLAILGMPGGWEVIVVLAIGLLLFGGRLPEVGKSLGRSLVEFRKGLRGLRDEAGLDEIDDIRRDFHDAALDVRNDIDNAEHATDTIDAEFTPTDPDTTEEGNTPSLGDAPKLDEGDGDKPPAFGYQR
ncbi:MAG: twin-arginine translocase TatA/TatE family subunit [Planctomycetota bacterium]|nr:twin-arginine translocase TatA/TatE family subunit [Planctomycetota bacterium]